MAELQENQKQFQRQRKHKFECSTSALLCGLMILVVCSTASGNENMKAEGNHNYTATHTFPLEKRIRREIPATETEVQKATLVAHSGTEAETETGAREPEETFDKSRNLNNPYKELNIYKRAPSGFIGMRGKKENGDDYFNPSALDWNIDPLFYQNIEDYNDNPAYAENERYKKAPNAFYGVRGKKMPNHSGNGGYNHLNEMLQELEEERIRERMLEDFIGRLALATAQQNEINKRAPTGFTGLRGKRPTWNTNGNENDENQLETTFEKRAPVNAFVGVRGKKDVSNQQDVHQILFKRSPSDRFPYNFFQKSFSGKRRFADFNNKFVAVRGKKDAVISEDINEEQGQEQTQTQALSQAQAQIHDQTPFTERQRLRYLVNLLPSFVDNARNGKRVPNGFTGLRGKRSAAAVLESKLTA